LRDAVVPKQQEISDDTVIHVYDDAGNVIETHEHKGQWRAGSSNNENPFGMT